MALMSDLTNDLCYHKDRPCDRSLYLFQISIEDALLSMSVSVLSPWSCQLHGA